MSIRIYTESKHKTLYNDLRQANVIKEAHNLFFICAALGYINNKKIPIKDKNERFYVHHLDKNEMATYYAMTIQSNNMDWESITDFKKMFAEIEEYANGGMEVLIDDFLSDYIVYSEEEPHLSPPYEDNLPIKMLSYLFAISGNTIQ